MTITVNILKVTTGLNNQVVAHRLPFDGDTGVGALEEADNVLIDKSGEIATRRGIVKVQDGTFHSTFRCNGGFYIVKDYNLESALYKAVPNSDGSLELYGIRSSLSYGAKMDFVELNGEFLYCNGSQNGILKQDTSSPWPEQSWTGPESSIEMVSPPVGEHIDILSGRILISAGQELFYTEHGLVGLIDEAGNRVRLESRIVMVCAVQSGVFISDENSIYFISGINPKDWTIKQITNYPAIEWSREQGLVDPSLFGVESFEMAALFGTVRGPCVGLPGGEVINLIDKDLTMPKCGVREGSIMVVDDTTIIQS